MSAVMTTRTEAPAGQRDFPPFDRDTFYSQLVWLILTFVLLYWLMAKVGLPRIQRVLAERGRKIDEELAEAERLNRRAETLAAEHRRTLTAARSRAQSIIDESYLKQAMATEEGHRGLDLRMNAQIKAANERTAMAKDAAMGDIGIVVADAASAIVERLLGRAPSRKTVSTILSDVVKN
jgi:F-type H+-transporting ATPase subunit b